jgi:hypothetical protein
LSNGHRPAPPALDAAANKSDWCDQGGDFGASSLSVAFTGRTSGGPVSALASLLLVSVWGLPSSGQPIADPETGKRMFITVLVTVCLNLAVPGTCLTEPVVATRLRVSQGVLGTSSALSQLEIQRLGLPDRQSRSTRSAQGLVTGQVGHIPGFQDQGFSLNPGTSRQKSTRIIRAGECSKQ